jgi:hypothetical protein
VYQTTLAWNGLQSFGTSRTRFSSPDQYRQASIGEAEHQQIVTSSGYGRQRQIPPVPTTQTPYVPRPAATRPVLGVLTHLEQWLTMFGKHEEAAEASMQVAEILSQPNDLI